MNLSQIYSKTEFQFKKLHRYFPDELYIKLLSLGFTDKSFKYIQQEMDRLYAIQKIESEFTPLDNYDGESPF